MLFENRNNGRYRAVRLNAWITQTAGLLTSMAGSCFVAAVIIPLLDGKWPASPGLWVVAGVMLFLGALLFLNFLSIEDGP